ncbi:TRM11 family SAM-dependent methyltransferase [Krasilnikovia sp. MM14-A1259]|uniref:TRM11 family SAM-dependent methyltransferase n=1 Tax=Krasilnikovia sp. MM14-A1259 TaxID=3373539 RepID=UPI003814AC2B
MSERRPTTPAFVGSPARLIEQGYPGSVWVTGQKPSRELRKGRYAPESITHPGKMLPPIARYAIQTYTDPGDVVLDPMAGIGTTVVEAMHLSRHGVGVEYEDRWAALAAVNIALAERHGATGDGEVYTGDSRKLPSLLPPPLRGRVALVVTSPPYGPSTHGHVRTPGPRRGKVRKIHHRYGDSDNLAYRDHDTLAAGFTEILAGCRAVLRPGGHVAITARPYRRHGELVDIPGMVVAAGHAAGLELVEECVALMAGVRDGVLVPRASFFQQKNVRDAITAGDPQWIQQHEDVVILKAGLPQTTHHDPAPSTADPAGPHTDRLDPFTASRVDRRAHPAPAANIRTGGGSATHPRPTPDRDVERTAAPCPPYSRPTPGDAQPDTTFTASDPKSGSSATAGQR